MTTLHRRLKSWHGRAIRGSKCSAGFFFFHPGLFRTYFCSLGASAGFKGFVFYPTTHYTTHTHRHTHTYHPTLTHYTPHTHTHSHTTQNTHTTHHTHTHTLTHTTQHTHTRFTTLPRPGPSSVPPSLPCRFRGKGRTSTKYLDCEFRLVVEEVEVERWRLLGREVRV